MTISSVQGLKRSDYLVALGLFVLMLITGGLRMAGGVCGVFHDDAIYVGTAKSLADGDGYRLMGVPGTPPQTKYPILYPAVLAAVWKIWSTFPDNVVVMQWFSVASAAAALAIGYLYVLRFGYFTRAVAISASVLTATAASFLYFSTTTMAEMLFFLVVIVALWGVDHFLLKSGRSKIAEIGLGALSALPFLCRMIGAPLVVIVAWLLFRSKQRLHWFALGASIVVVPWMLWSVTGRGIWDQNQVDGYYTDYFGCWSSTGFEKSLRVVDVNSLATANGSTELAFEGLIYAIRQSFDSPWILPAITLLGLIPWFFVFTQLRTRQALPHFMAGYLGIILIWSWPPYRFLIPIMPLIIAYFLKGLVQLAQITGVRFTRPSVRWASGAVMGVLVLCNLGLLEKHWRLTNKTNYPYSKLSDEHVHWTSFQQMFGWIRENTSSEDVIASGFDSMVSLYCDRKSFRPFVYRPERLFYGDSEQELVTAEELKAILKSHQPRYVTSLPMPGFLEAEPFEAALKELRRDHTGWMRQVYQGDDPRFVVYEVDPRFEPSQAPLLSHKR